MGMTPNEAAGVVVTGAGLSVPWDSLPRERWDAADAKKLRQTLGWFASKGIAIRASCGACKKPIVKLDPKHHPPGVAAVFICGCTRREVVS